MKLDKRMHPIRKGEIIEDRGKRRSESKSSKKEGIEEMAVRKLEMLKIRHHTAWRWDNLIHIDMQFYINDFLFKEEFLWERRNKSVQLIKQFCVEMIKERLFDYQSGELKEGVGTFTVDFLEVAAEYMTRKILEEVKFYDKVGPWTMFKGGVFGSGVGIEDEHLLTIKLDIANEEVTYRDAFEWDLIGETDIPEEFAADLVTDMRLPAEFKNLISMAIRKQIKDYIFSVFQRMTQIFINTKEEAEKNKEIESKKVSEMASALNTRRNYALMNGVNTNPTINKINQPSINKTIFTTYSASNSKNTTQSSTSTSITKGGNLASGVNIPNQKDDIEKLNKLDDNLSKPVLHLFDYKLETQLGRKTYRSENGNSINNKPIHLNTQKPEFLKNYIPPSKSLNPSNSNPNPSSSNQNPNVTIVKSAENYTPSHTDGPNLNIGLPNTFPISIPQPINSDDSSNKTNDQPTKKSYNSSIRIPIIKTPYNINITNGNAGFKKKKQKLKKKAPQKKKTQAKVSYPKVNSETNKHILSIEDGTIIISKDILNFIDYYELIVINKKILAENFEEDNIKIEKVNEEKEEKSNYMDNKSSIEDKLPCPIESSKDCINENYVENNNENSENNNSIFNNTPDDSHVGQTV